MSSSSPTSSTLAARMGTESLTLIEITNDPGVAEVAIPAGVDCFMVDLERLGKADRQHGLKTLISDHSMSDVDLMRSAIGSAANLLVRVDPPHENSRQQIQEAVKRGADGIMLPMFASAREVLHALEGLDPDRGVVLLVETPAAAIRLPRILSSCDFTGRVHVGLNDLAIAMGLSFLFESLAGGFIDHLSHVTRSAGWEFGFGGVGLMDQGDVPGAWLVGEHVRLDSTAVILSRTFSRGARNRTAGYAEQVQMLRACEQAWREAPAEELAANRSRVAERIWNIAERRAT